ncbi:MAG: hypothetical protein R3B13_33480 [Polyangiaceae bacterium]
MAKGIRGLDWLPWFLLIPVLVVVRQFAGWGFALIVLVFAIVAQLAVNFWWGGREGRRQAARVKALADLPLQEREVELAKAEPNEAALVRLVLDEVVPAHQDPRAQAPRVFRYPMPPPILHKANFYMCAAMAMLPTVSLLTGHVRRSQRGWALLAALMFAGFALMSLLLARMRPEEIRVGASGLLRTSPFGRRTVVPWTAIERLQWGRFNSLLIIGHDGRRLLKVAPYLNEFNVFVEALIAEAERLRHAQRSAEGIDDANTPPQ